MGSTRQKKYSKLIQKDLSEIFQKEGKSIIGNIFATITDVEMTPDLGLARVYVSLMLAEDKIALINHINNNKSEIRKYLGNKIGKQVQRVPDLAFYLDDSAAYGEKMDAIFKKLDIPPENSES